MFQRVTGSKAAFWPTGSEVPKNFPKIRPGTPIAKGFQPSQLGGWGFLQRGRAGEHSRNPVADLERAPSLGRTRRRLARCDCQQQPQGRGECRCRATLRPDCAGDDQLDDPEDDPGRASGPRPSPSCPSTTARRSQARQYPLPGWLMLWLLCTFELFSTTTNG